MADFYISYINPIRFRREITPNDMPQVDEMQNTAQYYRGVYPLSNYRANWKLGEEIVIQIQTDLNDTFAKLIALVAYTESGTTQILPTDVTPSGWQLNGSNGIVLNYLYTPPSSGEYYFKTVNVAGLDDYISDVFDVRDNNQDLVEIKYYDTDNRFDGVFYDGSTLIWQPKAYFTGISMPGKPNAQYDIYTDDPAQPTRTNAETTRTIKLQLTDITTNHYSQLIDITSCDTLFTNSQPCLNPEIFEEEETANSDKMDITISMTRIETDNFVKNY